MSKHISFQHTSIAPERQISHRHRVEQKTSQICLKSDVTHLQGANLVRRMLVNSYNAAHSFRCPPTDVSDFSVQFTGSSSHSYDFQLWYPYMPVPCFAHPLQSSHRSDDSARIPSHDRSGDLRAGCSLCMVARLMSDGDGCPVSCGYSSVTRYTTMPSICHLSSAREIAPSS